MQSVSSAIGRMGILALLAFFSGCDSEEREVPAPVDLERPEVQLTVDPVTTVAELDTSRAVTVRIAPAEGGTVAATAADGTVFTLQIPPGAFLSANEITLTPVLSVQGLPLDGGLVASVHLAPEGLRFLVPATLTLEYADAGPGAEAQLLPFAFHGLGEEFHLYPAQVTAGRATFEIRHFSGYGVGRGTAAEADELRGEHSPTEPEDQANHHRGGDQQDYCTMLRHWGFNIYTTVQGSSGEQAIVDYAFNQYVAWQGALTGCDFAQRAAMVAQVNAELASAMTVAASKAHRRCVDENDPVQAANLLRLAAWAERFPEIGARAADIRAQAEKCARFELKLSSSVTSIDEYMSASASLTGEAPVWPMMLSGVVKFMGTGTSRYTSISYQSSECAVSVSDEPGELYVTDLELNLDGVANRSLLASQLALVLVPAGPMENLTLHYPDGFTNYDVDAIWVTVFSFFHPEDETGALRVQGFEVGSGSTFAVASFDLSGDQYGTQVTENSRIELLHTPEF